MVTLSAAVARVLNVGAWPHTWKALLGVIIRRIIFLLAYLIFVSAFAFGLYSSLPWPWLRQVLLNLC